MIAIVCGGRDYTDANRVRTILDAAVDRLGLHTIIEGECPTPVNADKLARDWALARGDVAVIAVEPGTNWPEAGPIRNAVMFKIMLSGDSGARRAVFCFPGGKGTKNMRGLAVSSDAVAKGVEVFDIK